MSVEEVAGGLDFFEAQTAERREGILVSVLAEVPAR